MTVEDYICDKFSAESIISKFSNNEFFQEINSIKYKIVNLAEEQIIRARNNQVKKFIFRF